MTAAARRRGLLLAVPLIAAGLVAATTFVGQPAPHLGRVAPTGVTQTGEPSAASPSSLPPSNEASAAPTDRPPAASTIVPGSVDRTSIALVATYDADVQLGFDDRSLGVDVAIAVTNRSGDGVDRIELNTITAPLGDLRLRQVRVDGRDVAATVRGQSIVVPLGGVLPNDATTLLRVRLGATFPSSLGGSSWLFTKTGGILQASRWLPWIGLQRGFERPNDGDPFFTALSPHVRVRITSDRRLVIATPGKRVEVDGTTQTFEAHNVRDFHIVASPWFRIRERRVGEWTVRAFVRPGFPTDAVMDDAADGLRRMSARAGAYPYATLTIAQTAGGYGLEGPGMIWIPTGYSGSWLHWTVYHEVAHQWFYGLVGSDGALQPFADETLATQLGQSVSGTARSTSCGARRLDLSIYRYSGRCYFGQIYVHGARVLNSVRRTMGSAAYWRAIRAYVAEHRFAMGSTREVLATLQAHTSRDLTPTFVRWFPSLY